MVDLPPAGWYGDPVVSGQERWWDGEQWSTQFVRRRPTARDPVVGAGAGTAGAGWWLASDGRWYPPRQPQERSPAQVPVYQPPVSWGVPVDPEPIDPLPESRGPWTAYRSDLRWSAQALVGAPALLLSTVILLVLSEAVVRAPPGVAFLLDIPTSLALAGFVGTQRVWFLHVLRGDPMPWHKVWTLTLSFVGRFVVLGLVIGLIVIPVFVVGAIVGHISGAPGAARTGSVPIDIRLIAIAGGLLIDGALTFVAPALALTFRSTKTALRVGLRMIRQMWPACAWYVIAPGLTLTFFATALPPSVINVWIGAGLGLIGGTLGLWFKGAAVAFYVRAFPATENDGAARR
jgi:hypothetical protein